MRVCVLVYDGGMRLRLTHTTGWVCEVDGDVTQCAQLLHALAGDPPAAKSLTRRERVLEVIRELSGPDHTALALEQILAEVMRRFPDTERRYLDQVVRDLANKTDLVTRTDWGTFSLSEKAN